MQSVIALLPLSNVFQVVVDDLGGTRRDAGNLGSGIYFASRPSTV